MATGTEQCNLGMHAMVDESIHYTSESCEHAGWPKERDMFYSRSLGLLQNYPLFLVEQCECSPKTCSDPWIISLLSWSTRLGERQKFNRILTVDHSSCNRCPWCWGFVLHHHKYLLNVSVNTSIYCDWNLMRLCQPSKQTITPSNFDYKNIAPVLYFQRCFFFTRCSIYFEPQ